MAEASRVEAQHLKEKAEASQAEAQRLKEKAEASRAEALRWKEKAKASRVEARCWEQKAKGESRRLPSPFGLFFLMLNPFRFLWHRVGGRGHPGSQGFCRGARD